jgi:nitrite reductase/ring-hydroxylating ferredoxin subunit
VDQYIKAAQTADLPPGSSLRIEVLGRRVALFNVDGTYYAIDDECTHRGGPLSEGLVAGGKVTCPWHAAKCDVRTGDVANPPAEQPVRSYNVRVAGTDLEIELAD